MEKAVVLTMRRLRG